MIKKLVHWFLATKDIHICGLCKDAIAPYKGGVCFPCAILISFKHDEE